MSSYEEEFKKFAVNLSIKDMQLAEELEKLKVIIDINRLIKSGIKKIELPLTRFMEWKCFDSKKQKLHKTQMFEACLNTSDAQKAKKLNRIYATELWGLFDESVKEKMNFEDFVD